MDINEHWQVWSISFLIRKQGRQIIINEQLAEFHDYIIRLHKPVIKKFKRRRVYAI